MEVVGGAASLITVLSLAVQLGDSVYKLSRLIKSIKNAPKELQVVSKDLDRLRGILSEVALITQQQQSQDPAPLPSANFLAALQDCRERFQSFEAFASEVAASLQRKGLQKSIGALRFPARRGNLRQLYGDLDRSISHLGTFLVLNSTQIQ